MNTNVKNKYASKLDDQKNYKLFFGLDLDQFRGLSKYIHGFYISTMGVRAPMLVDIQGKLHLFGELGHSLVGMYNFLVWAQEIDPDSGEANIESQMEIMETIGHDLNGMHERFFVPRTSSYVDMTEDAIKF